MLSSASTLALLPRSSLSQLSSEQLLILFLVLQRRLGQASPAFPYLDLLPSSYSSLEWWSETELRLLCARRPAEAVIDAVSAPWSDEDEPVLYYREQCTRIRRECAQLNSLLVARHPQLPSCRYDDSAASVSTTGLPLTLLHPTAPPADHPLCGSADAPLPCFRCQVSAAEYQWAHSTVASRSCYWPPSTELAVTSPSPVLSCCLVPFLDLLNHSSFVTAACAYEASTRRYQLSVRGRHPATGDEEEGLKVKAGEEVFISYGELSNWQLLTRYGFVLTDSQDERVDLPVDRIEAFIARHCGEKRSRGPHQPSASQETRQSAEPALTSDPTPADYSPSASIRCCCTRAALPQTLTAQPPPSSLPVLPALPPMSSKHSALLGLLGLYDLPRSFPLSCCHPQWHLLTFIKVRTAFVGVQGRDGVDQAQLQRLAVLMAGEDETEGSKSRGWIDAEHERRGRGLLIALARRVEGRWSGERRSLDAEMAELQWLQQHRARVDVESRETGVSWLSRVLSAQFRISRRRMLLGFIHQQQVALQTLD